jgi:hypothetical protein
MSRRNGTESSKSGRGLSATGLGLMATLLLVGPLAHGAGSGSYGLQAHEPGLRLVGQGRLNWFGISVYEASLWTTEGRFEQFAAHEKVALEIRYLKNIPARRLVDSARTEWDRLGLLQEETIEKWCAQVADIWPDVTPGDRLTTVVTRQGTTRFYFNGQFAGEIRDAEFGPTLLEIWLHPETRSKSLRRSLLGEQA